MSFFKELKRRNVFRVGIAYAVTTWLLLQVTDIVFPRIGLPDSAVTLVIALLTIGFIPALIFAWAFEMTPDGLKREKDVDRAQSITPQTAHKLDRVIIVILVLALGYFIWESRFTHQKGSESVSQPLAGQAQDAGEKTTPAPGGAAIEAGTSIAVLPFVNMSADADNEYFSDGITEELLNVLVRVSALHVASRTSAFAYKGKDLPVSQIASELKVANIVEGSVRKAGNRVRITAQLINAEADRHIWSETYERELDDIFKIQEEISGNIVNALKVALNVDEKAAVDHANRPTRNTQAYELYLQGRFAWRQRHEDNIRHAIDLFEQAIALDPNFARAYEGLASAWGVLPSWSDVLPVEAALQAKPAAIRALQLDPTLSLARAILAEIDLDDHRWADAISEYQKAIRNEPRNPTLHQWLGEALGFMGYTTRALAQMRIAYELDPASPVINQSMTWLANQNHDDDLALKHAAITGNLGMADREIINSLDARARKGDWATIFAWLDAKEDVPQMVKSCFHAWQDPALRTQLPAQLDQYFEDLNGARPGFFTDFCLALAGRPNRAAQLALADVGDDWQDIDFFWSSNNVTGALRQTKAFRQALVDFGLLDYYRQNGWPDLCHPIGKEDFKCDD